jgi:uncharacterized membrane protein HdeD (DUF308 family)
MRESLTAPLLADEIVRRWKWLLAVGILSVLGGVFAILVPLAASISAAILVGWAMLFGAAAQWLAAWEERETRDRMIHALFGLLYTVAGLYLLLFPVSGTVTLTVVLVAFFFATGVIRLILAAQNRDDAGAVWMGLGGVLALVLGVLILADFPSSASWALGLLVGVELLFAGWQLIMLALLAREAREAGGLGRVDGAQRPATGTGY